MNHNHPDWLLRSMGECPGCDEWMRMQAGVRLAENGATLADVRMALYSALLETGRKSTEAEALIFLHEAAVTRA